MGGKSSSKSSTQETITNIDKRMVVDGSSVGVSSDSSNVSVSTIDLGAVMEAFSFARDAQGEASGAINDAFKFARDAQGEASGAINDVFKFARDAQGEASGAINDAFKFAGDAQGEVSGAINDAFKFAGASGDRISDSFDKVLGLADTVLSGSLKSSEASAGLLAQAFETAKTTESGSIDQKTMMVLAGVAAVAVVAYSKRAK